MDEIEYINMIDASFPYDDEAAWKAIIDQGVQISDNAAYMALHEICGAPSEVTVAELERMLAYWSLKFEHPTKSTVVRAARVVMRDVSLSETDTLRYLEEVGAYPDLYNAAGTIWWAAPKADGHAWKVTPRVEKKYDEILTRWRGHAG